MEPSLHTIRSCLLYEFKLHHSATQAAGNIRAAFGVDSVTDRTAQLWFQRFRSGDESLEDRPRSGRPSVVNEDALRAMMEADPRQTCSELASQLGCEESTIRIHLHAIGKVRKLEKWVPSTLTQENKTQRLVICSSLISRHNTDPFLDRILTCDEKWVLYNNIRRSYQWLSPGEPPRQVPKPELHPKKVLLCVWWTAAGIIHYEILESGETITAAVYCSQLERVQKQLTKKQPALINRKGVVLLQDNARPHTAKVTRQKIHSLSWEILPHPPYSPDISPTDYHLFRSLDNPMGNKCFENRQELENDLQQFFSSKDTSFYRDGIYHLLNRWQKVIDSDGNYFNE